MKDLVLNENFEKRGRQQEYVNIWKYLLWTFLIAWIMQTAVAILYRKGLAIIGQLLISAMMFTPLLGVLLSGYSLSGMGWKFSLKGNFKALLIAWFCPAFLTSIGAALYFINYPEHFDISGDYLVVNVGAEALTQLEKQGLSYPLFVLISVISSLTYAPLINMFLAVGEEAGWRGFLYPQLKIKYGKKKGWLIGGIIWGIWHWPLIWLIGYEYGTDYAGFPIIGMILFCIFSIAIGILCDLLYEKTKCIWIPSVCHGAINAASTLPLAVCITTTGSLRLLGPAPMGFLSSVPFILFTIIMLLKKSS